MPMRVLLFLAFSLSAFGCALCSLYSPTAHVNTEFITQNDKIKTIKFTWSFSENFSNLMRQNFDINSDGSMEKNELREIRLNLLNYLVPRHYLTQIEHFYKDENTTKIELNLDHYKLYFDNERLKFDVAFDADIAVRDGEVISIEIYDEGQYFHFKFENEKALKLNDKIYAVPNVNSNIIFYTMADTKTAKEYDKKPRLSDIAKQDRQTQSSHEYSEIDRIDEMKFDSISNASALSLYRLKEILKQNLAEFDGVSFVFLLIISFIYGFLHAAGAGHGKALTAAYFASTGGSYTKAAFFSLKIGFMHVVGAFLFVCIMFFTLSQVSANFTKNATQITTTISAFIIIIICIYLTYNKFKLYHKLAKSSQKSHMNLNSLKFQVALQNTHKSIIFTTNSHIKDCTCSACVAIENLSKPKKSYAEWLIAACVALIPCPGTILIFVLAHEVGSYFAGFLSGIFMAFGMSAVIFIAAIFGAKINQNGFSRLNKFKIYAEFMALFVMFIVGIFMIYISTTQVSVF
ncbi:DUF1007 family protein [Campylobacter sp. faydin G-105]|uniref:HoxN/HupN/NixA family nickel/cobalt transporter n=1 Tax=Campylobacter anatolicus TaxID=2829105 RepID=UPI001B8F0C21|nr:DUF1007 family protein [Campylobacter anatolicus]MBR8461313.1 DUF1007 family protein [Campylobacter anatolicus]